MDKITGSLKQYLDSVGISYRTMFNSDGGWLTEYPTTTSFFLRNTKDSRLRMWIVVDIFPDTNRFHLFMRPSVGFDTEEEKIKLYDFESKWNHCDMMTTFVVVEELDVAHPNACGFRLELSGYCEECGLGKDIWKKYLERIENDTYAAWEEVSELTDFYKN